MFMETYIVSLVWQISLKKEIFKNGRSSNKIKTSFKRQNPNGKNYNFS